MAGPTTAVEIGLRIYYIMWELLPGEAKSRRLQLNTSECLANLIKSFSLLCGVYMIGLVCAFSHTGCMLRVHFCKLDVINHYFCDLLPLLKLSCSSTYVNELLVLCFGALNIFAPILTILSSYIFIISNILHIRSLEGRSKAFSTCSSHTSVVATLYGSAAFMYLQPSSVNSLDQGKVSSVFYTIVVPMLNPLIYSLRNKDVNVALKKTLKRIFL
ncbi:olfactory receptor 8G1-like [Dama dama]